MGDINLTPRNVISDAIQVYPKPYQRKVTFIKDVLMDIPKSDLLGVTMAVTQSSVFWSDEWEISPSPQEM